MVMDPKEVQERLDGPPPLHTRNINLDTHIGAAPQRPYALLEDHLASVTGGFRSVDDLKAALASAPAPEGLPKGAPNPNEVTTDRYGDLVRYVVATDGPDRYVNERGQIMDRVRFVPRYVALSQEQARAADTPDRPTDSWNGFTWLRGGYKPERDFPVMMQQSRGQADQPRVFEQPASATDVAVIHHEMRRAEAARPSLPVEDARPERKSSARDKE